MYKLGHNELVEEIFIADFNEAQLIDWLRTNSNDNGYSNLCSKYEPIWSQRSSKLKLAVANFGQNISNLYKLYNETDDYLIKSSVLRNPAFGDSIGSHWPGINDDEIKKLYKKRKPFFGLFEQLFCNPKISPEFIADLFSTTDYQEMRQADLVIILGYLTRYTKNAEGKVPVECWMENQYFDTAERRAIESIVEFIANFNFKLSKGEVFDTLFDFEHCLTLLPDFRFHLDTKLQVDVLRKFDPERFAKKVSNDRHSDMEKESVILSIQRFFAKNFFRHSSPDYLYSDFKNSVNVRERIFYYQNSNLSDLFAVEKFRSEYLPVIEDIVWDQSSPDEAFAYKMDSKEEELEIYEYGSVFAHRRTSANKEFHKRLQLEEHRFVASIALNRRFFVKNEDRNWLQRLCKETDRQYGLMSSSIPIFGTGTCSEVFDAKLAELQKLYPEEFSDLTESEMLLAIQTELTELKTIRTSITNLRSDVSQGETSLAKVIENQEEIEKTTSQKLKELQEQLERTNKHLNDILHSSGEPKDIISRLAFNMPIIGKFLRRNWK